MRVVIVCQWVSFIGPRCRIVLNKVAERHDEMADYMQRVGAQPVELSVEGRNMLSVADKNAVGSRRAGWRVIARVAQKENVKGNEQRATYATEHVVKVGTELRGSP